MIDSSINNERLAPEILFSAIEEQLSLGRKASFTVTGMSMWPFICHGRDQVVLEACEFSQLKVGDIVLLQTPLENYMLHRVTGLKEDFFETSGDGNCFRDGWFPKECLKGRVTEIIRKGKSIDCSRPLWKAAFTLWRGLFPVRKYLLRFFKQIGHLKARSRKRTADS